MAFIINLIILDVLCSWVLRLYVLQVLEGVIKYRWNALPIDQRDGMKNYISDVIVKVIIIDNLLSLVGVFLIGNLFLHL